MRPGAGNCIQIFMSSTHGREMLKAFRRWGKARTLTKANQSKSSITPIQNCKSNYGRKKSKRDITEAIVKATKKKRTFKSRKNYEE